MAEAWRANTAARNIHYSPGAREDESHAAESQLDLPELPESASPVGNPALNRSAEAVGRSVGNAVAGVRRLPQQFDKLRSKIHVVPRETGVGAVEEFKDTAADWREAAEDTVAELKQRAELYSQEVSESASRRWDDLRRQTELRIARLRREVRLRLGQLQRWESARPLYVIGACAAVSFAAGVALRIWRSSRD